MGNDQNNRNHEVYHSNKNSEEVQDIIERMPTKFGWWITGIVLFIVSLLLFFGWIVSYPDVVSGKIIINTTVSPIKLVAKTSGRLKLKIPKSQSEVQAGEVVALIQNTTSYDTLALIRNILTHFDPNNEVHDPKFLHLLPAKAPLGSLTSFYYTFLQSLQQWKNFKEDKLYDEQIKGLTVLLHQQRKAITNSRERVKVSKANLHYTRKFYHRDSILFQEKVIAEAKLDQTKLSYLNSRQSYQNIFSLQIASVKEARQTQAEIDQVRIQKSEKKEELRLALIASYNSLRNKINRWEESYLFKAPFDGKVQFLGFWTDNQFIQSGQAVFTIIPKNNQLYGQVMLPAMGAGKVKTGQEVIIKLNDFPYMEYGSINGTVNAISLTTRESQTQQGSMETYLVTVKLDSGLMTNYGKKLPFRQESHGTAEIIAKDRRLIQRLFDNLKYVIKE